MISRAGRAGRSRSAYSFGVAVMEADTEFPRGIMYMMKKQV